MNALRELNRNPLNCPPEQSETLLCLPILKFQKKPGTCLKDCLVGTVTLTGRQQRPAFREKRMSNTFKFFSCGLSLLLSLVQIEVIFHCPKHVIQLSLDL